MERKIYEVYAKVVDATGAYNTLSGYPKTFDSKNYGNDIEKTLKRAQGGFSECVGAMCKNDERQLQTVILMDATGSLLDRWTSGAIADVEPSAE